MSVNPTGAANALNGKATSRQRLFFALWPDEATRERIVEATTAAIEPCGGRRVPAENFHITLRFLGPVDINMKPKLAEAAGMTFGLKQQIRLDQLGFWEASKIAWLGCSKVHDDLLRLVVNLNTELGGLGFPHENRPFRPHVTLVRGAEQPPEIHSSGNIEWRSEEFVLCASTAGPKGAKYEVLERFPLQDPRS